MEISGFLFQITRHFLLVFPGYFPGGIGKVGRCRCIYNRPAGIYQQAHVFDCGMSGTLATVYMESLSQGAALESQRAACITISVSVEAMSWLRGDLRMPCR